jgi:hypothetical protein
MTFLAGCVFAVLVALATVVSIRGADALLRRQWKAGLEVLVGIAMFGVTTALLTGTAFLLGLAQLDGTALEPSDKARLLAEAISEMMNVSAWGFPIGLVVGAGLVFRARRRRLRTLRR